MTDPDPSPEPKCIPVPLRQKVPVPVTQHCTYLTFFYSHLQISRESIDACKDYFRDELQKTDWVLMVELKKLFEILWFIESGLVRSSTWLFELRRQSYFGGFLPGPYWTVESRSGKLFCQQEEKSEHSICYSWVSFHVRKNYKLTLCYGFFIY